MGRWAESQRWWKRVVQTGSRVLPWVGLVLLVLASFFWAHEWSLSRSALHAVGTVTELEGKLDRQGQINYFPHVRFKLPNGELVQAVSKVGDNPADFAAGDVLPVIYAAGDPQDAEIATKTRVYFVAIVLGVLGTIIFDLGAVLWIVRRREEMSAAVAKI